MALVAAALVLSFFGFLPFIPVSLVYSTALVLFVCLVTNYIFTRVFSATANVESVYITALILVLIISPQPPSAGRQYFMFLVWASVWAMASKFILAIKKKHLFNPAAFAVALTALSLNHSASWWVGTAVMAPAVFLGGVLMVRKLRSPNLVYAFLAAALAATLGYSIFKGSDLITSAKGIILNSPLLFFAFIMLTEPQTTPPTSSLKIFYGAFVGFLFAPWVHLASVYSTPELALLSGNVFSYLVSPKQKLILGLKNRLKVAAGTFDFIFRPSEKLAFAPGQYLEWTLGHDRPDSRGNRRYFTIASSPTEDDIIVGVKFYPNASSYKKTLAGMKQSEVIVASQLSGDFVMPKDKTKKLVFIAGGIGVTPFRIMIKYLLDKNERRNIVFFYSNKTVKDVAYKEIFDQAQEKLGIKTIYPITDPCELPKGWQGFNGYINARSIANEVPDFRERIFYISGPHGMVTAFEKTLKDMGVPGRHIKIDFFPGFA
jgi:ferredoxin-NADP reductase/Na+-translocating ferredoxin:NAD+ oxidoreductase RnfD subunit